MFESFFAAYPEYETVRVPTSAMVDSQKSMVPDCIIKFWEEYGFGVFMNGYLKVIDPTDFTADFDHAFDPCGRCFVPLFLTAMADIIAWQEDFLIVINCRHFTVNGIGASFKFFFNDLTDDQFLDQELSWTPFVEASSKLGVPKFDQCFGYFPALVAGGFERIENLHLVSTKEHIWMLTELGGKIGF